MRVRNTKYTDLDDMLMAVVNISTNKPIENLPSTARGVLALDSRLNCSSE
jgi:hypothetical protein